MMPKPLVLIVDDEIDVRRVLRELLSLHGLRIAEAVDGDQAIEMAINLKPDLILLDFFMPMRDGLETCQALRADERTRHIPIIMLSGLGPDADKFANAGAGPDYCVDKPVDFPALLELVERILKRPPAGK